jgi:hypothetical protein
MESNAAGRPLDASAAAGAGRRGSAYVGSINGSAAVNDKPANN